MIKTVLFFVLCLGANAFNIPDDAIPELKYLNTSVDPCEDFYGFTCGNFRTFHPRPDNAILVDHFTLNTQDSLELSKNILARPNGRDDPKALKKARSIYKACVDTKYADTIPNPELSVIAEVNGFPLVTKNKFNKAFHKTSPFSWDEVANLISEYGIPMLFGTIQSLPHYVDSKKTQIYAFKESLSLPVTVHPSEATTDDIIENALKNVAQQRANAPFDIFLYNVTKKMQLATANYYTSDEDIQENLAETKKFMIDLLYADNVTMELVPIEMVTDYTVSIETMQKWTEQQFGDKTSVDWLRFFQLVFKKTGVEITKDTEVLTYTTFVQTLYGIINLVENTDSDVLKNYCLLRIFLYMAPDSDAPTRQAFLDYFNGINKPTYAREDYCARKILDVSSTASISYALAYEYQLRFFNVNKLQKATEMIFDLWDSISEILRNDADWMDDITKNHALNKIENMITLLGYPEMSESKQEIDYFYRNLRVCGWDNFGNSKRLRAFKLAYQLSQAKLRDRTAWDKSPFDANAYYTRPTNRITFPVAMLNPVFFNGNISILDYARIGSIIGHEITHAFDRTGQQYNEEGLLIPWMTDETKDMLKNKSDCFVDQYNGFKVEETGRNVDGSSTLNENLADNGGIRGAYRAVKKYISRHLERDSTAKYTTEQLFFIGFGTMWCAEASKEYFENLSGYSPPKYRVNGPLSNLEEFSHAFNCPVGSTMNPEQKCRLW